MKILLSLSINFDGYGKANHVDVLRLLSSVRPLLNDPNKLRSATKDLKSLALAVSAVLQSDDPLAKLVVLETYGGNQFKFIGVIGTEIIYDGTEALRKTQIFNPNNSVLYKAGSTKVEYFPYLMYPAKSLSALVEKE